VPGKRKKDPEYYALRATLETLLDGAEAYRRRLEGELAATRGEPEPYMHLVRALERQITIVRRLEELLDDQVWPVLVELANSSAYVEHARTRDYF
jgi:hypothetical protein